MIPVTADSICFLTFLYSSYQQSYTCRITQQDGTWMLAATGPSTNVGCRARCLANISSASASILGSISQNEVLVEQAPSFLVSTVADSACFLTGMYSSSGQDYWCAIDQTTTPGQYGQSTPYWYLYSAGTSSHRYCYARCLSFLSWGTAVGNWQLLQDIGYGGFSESITYG